jgi:hypothetical protein
MQPSLQQTAAACLSTATIWKALRVSLAVLPRRLWKHRLQEEQLLLPHLTQAQKDLYRDTHGMTEGLTSLRQQRSAIDAAERRADQATSVDAALEDGAQDESVQDTEGAAAPAHLMHEGGARPGIVYLHRI